MRGVRRIILLGVLAVVGGGLFAGWYYRWQNITPRMRADFEWFQGLGFPDVNGKEYVTILTGNGMEQMTPDGTGWTTGETVNGFLLSSNSNTFTVFTEFLEVHTFTNRPETTHQFEISFTNSDLQTNAEREFRRIWTRAPDNWEPTGQPMEQTREFALAWACWRQGLDRQARQIYDEIKETPKLYKRDRALHLGQKLREYWQTALDKWRSRKVKAIPWPPPDTRSFRQKLEDDLALMFTQRTMHDIKNATMTRPQSVVEFERILHRFPHSQVAGQAEQDLKALKRVIAEEEAHGKTSPEELARMPVETRVRELIFRLRDTIQLPSDEYLETNTEAEITNSPVVQLLRLGYPAVPQLIGALNDTSPTCLNYSVGGWAAELLRRISGTSALNLSTPVEGEPTTMSLARRETAEEWWTKFQAKGEEQMLVEILADNTSDPLPAATLLAKRHSDAAAATIIKRIEGKTNDIFSQNALVKVLAGLTNDAAAKFFERELTNGAALKDRLAAAIYFFQHERKETATATMLQEWRNQCNQPGAQGSRFGEEDLEGLVSFLGTNGSTATLSALETNFATIPTRLQETVIRSLTAELSDHMVSASIQAVVEHCFADALDNGNQATLHNGYQDYSIGELAAQSLSQFWPDRYKFDMLASPEARNQARIACLNEWLEARHLTLRPLPPSLTNRVSTNDANKIVEVRWTTNSMRATPAFAARIERLKGKPLKSADLAELLSDYARKPETASVALEIWAYRDADLAGVRLNVSLVPAWPGSAPQGFQVNERVWLGPETMFPSSEGLKDTDLEKVMDVSFSALERCTKANYWESLADAVKQAELQPPEKSFLIMVRLGE